MKKEKVLCVAVFVLLLCLGITFFPQIKLEINKFYEDTVSSFHIELINPPL